MDENEVFDWEQEIEDDGEDREFITLEPGKYDFTIASFERGSHEAKPGGKAPTCKKAVIKIKIATDEGDCYITEYFLLYKKMEWKISQFFRCLGLKKRGEKATTSWDKVVGCTGKCEITKDKGKEEGVFFNHVKKWLDPEETEEAEEWS